MTPQDTKPIPTCLRLGCPCHEGGECESAKRLDTKEEQLARTIHEWYLESVKELHPESYNPNAQKSYDDLTEEQKSMDRYMARKIQALLHTDVSSKENWIEKFNKLFVRDDGLMDKYYDDGYMADAIKFFISETILSAKKEIFLKIREEMPKKLHEYGKFLIENPHADPLIRQVQKDDITIDLIAFLTSSSEEEKI